MSARVDAQTTARAENPVMNARAEELRKLPLPDRLRLVEELWESIAAELDHEPVHPDGLAEMERRRRDYEKDPEAGTDWKELQRRLGQR